MFTIGRCAPVGPSRPDRTPGEPSGRRHAPGQV